MPTKVGVWRFYLILSNFWYAIKQTRQCLFICCYAPVAQSDRATAF